VDDDTEEEAAEPVPEADLDHDGMAVDDDHAEYSDDDVVDDDHAEYSDDGGSDPETRIPDAEIDDERHGPLESIALRPRLFLAPILVLVTLAVVAGLLRPPVYKAEAQLLVGSVIRDFQGAEGQVQAIQQLTDIYSRLVGSTGHMEKVDEALGETVPPTDLSAAPIPSSALLRIDAEGADQEQAQARADAGATELVAYVGDLQGEAAVSSQQLLDEISTASAEVAAAQTARTAAQTAVTAATGTGGLAAAQTAFEAADATLTTAQLKLDTLRARYSTIQGANSGGIALSVFTPAIPQGSDRMSMLQIYVIAAVLFGGLLGMALATLSANRWQIIPTQKRPTATP
jgi:capsular polysaccharide biosynthesis protein